MNNNISCINIYREVMEKIEEYPGRYYPLRFLKSFSFEKSNEWIETAIKKV